MPAFPDGYRAHVSTRDGFWSGTLIPVDPRALHAEAVVVDTHDNLLMCTSRRPRAQPTKCFCTSWLPKLREGGVDVQVLPVYVDDNHRPEGGLRQTLKTVESGWTVPRSTRSCTAAGSCSCWLEGCKDLDLLSTLCRVGVRIPPLTHFGRTLLADGSGEDPAESRVTKAGVEAATVMEELGPLLDVSHLGGIG